ncbi:MAG TPA: hypothetical protein RMH85_17205 [Polyangiaceae bacterium LLY-WYZ-15_(1-7)]|nr:hypothetical protein [Myxococcales bacterium]MAT26512.1 hypothetical protein [Sandaracinus sp.]HJL03045.1 hypothetical protein [Polyangiaceae bacterium LLY-WYZ-15_(1-7)]MBJ70417.1 hypothetical protein [Sandaracinus sp.]HJL10241.1 hypothetical protein [Polyangiaceae bacterium LLY-WYZ-15_(1-7)]
MALIAWLALAGCGDDDASLDAGPALGDDAGATLDAGTPPMDSGPPPMDAGPPPEDSGPPPVDAGPPPMDAGPPPGAFGDPCTLGAECASGVCLTGAGCTRLCDLDVPHACRAEGTLCLPTGSGDAVCGGPSIETGPDTGDDANLGLGDCVMRSLVPLGADADLFQVRAAFDGRLQVVARPESGVDLALDFYDGAGSLVARSTMGGAGELEGLRFDRWTAESIVYVLVRDDGSSIANPYRVCVEEVTEE